MVVNARDLDLDKPPTVSATIAKPGIRRQHWRRLSHEG